MFLKRFEDAKPYEAANHRACTGLRLQGWEEGSSKSHWIGLSHFMPGGGAGPDSNDRASGPGDLTQCPDDLVQHDAPSPRTPIGSTRSGCASFRRGGVAATDIFPP